MTEAPLISIITASFNALEGLKATVASVAAQSFRSVEHIVIDGGSSDGTREYLESLGNAVRWISEPDKGIADALNKGIAMASGRYVLILQAEDTLANSDSLSMAAPFLNESDLVSFCVNLRHPNRDILLPSGGLGWRSTIQMPLPHQGLFASRASFERAGAFDPEYRIAMDYEWLLRVRRLKFSVRKVDSLLAIMPATGISTLSEWDAVTDRLAENRRAQNTNLVAPFERFANRIYWALYPFYKWLRVKIG